MTDYNRAVGTLKFLSRFERNSEAAAFHNIKIQMAEQCNLSTCYRLAHSYKDGDESDEQYSSQWIIEIENEATTKIKKLAKIIKALIGIPDLEADYRIRAEEIIAVFPLNDPIHGRLRLSFAEILDEPEPHAPDVERLKLQRDIADRLFS